ncbi:MAG: riboflavin synthase [Chitinophagaceae bacterium]|nr:riboflavin synthase [Chitinophagaceae bacterium]
MFTGIVECEGTLVNVVRESDLLIIEIQSRVSHELKVDQSVAHNGICLTVTAVNGNIHRVCAVQETILKTTIGSWKVGDMINLERCMTLNGRLDGHLVQGHVDATARCVGRSGNEQNPVSRFAVDTAFSHLIIEKGSVCINGTSLTCYNVSKDEFDVAIIPYTFEHTSIRFINEQDHVNIEFDVIGKYVARMHQIS